MVVVIAVKNAVEFGVSKGKIEFFNESVFLGSGFFVKGKSVFIFAVFGEVNGKLIGCVGKNCR